MVTILIADDSLFMRTLERQTLMQSGYEVIGEATNGDEAVALYRKFKPDLMLLDIVMPGSEKANTGIDALKQIVTEYPLAKVVICSSLDQQAIIASALKLGARGFVAKPFEPKELSEVMSACMDLDVFSEIGSIGVGHAATALSDIVKEHVTIEIPRLRTGPPHLVPRVYGRHDKPTTAIHTHLTGNTDCDIILAFDADEAKKMATMIATTSSIETNPEMEKSTIEEIGSIMTCSFFSAMADFIGFQLMPAPPQTVTDSFDTIIDNFLANQALTSNSALIFDTHFKRRSSSADGILLLFPSLEFQKLLINEGKKWLETTANTLSPPNLDTVIRRTPANSP